MFSEIKQVVTHDTLLIYLDFNKRFDIHMDASELQLGSGIIQYGKPIAFYIRKLKGQKKRYTVIEN